MDAYATLGSSASYQPLHSQATVLEIPASPTGIHVIQVMLTHDSTFLAADARPLNPRYGQLGTVPTAVHDVTRTGIHASNVARNTHA